MLTPASRVDGLAALWNLDTLTLGKLKYPAVRTINRTDHDQKVISDYLLNRLSSGIEL